MHFLHIPPIWQIYSLAADNLVFLLVPFTPLLLPFIGKGYSPSILTYVTFSIRMIIGFASSLRSPGFALLYLNASVW